MTSGGDEALLLRVFVGEADAHEGRPLFEAILELLRRRGVGGATVLGGIAGYGRSSVVHAAHLLRLSEDLPIVVEAVDRPEVVEAVLDELRALVGGALITTERVLVR